MQNDFPSRNGAPINFTTGLMIKGVNLSGNDGAKAVSLKVKDTDTVSTTIYDWIRATDALVADIVQNGGSAASTFTVSQISDASTLGASLLKATTTTQAQTLLGVGGATSVTISQITDASVIGKSLLGSNSATAARGYIGLGTAATQNSTAFATAIQGTKADTALQPGALPAGTTVQISQINDATTFTKDLLTADSAATAQTKLGLGSAAIQASTAFATSAQGGLADSALQPGALPEGTTVTISQVSNSSSLGRSLMAVDTQADLKTLVGVASGTTVTMSQISDSGVTGRSILRAGSTSAAQIAIGLPNAATALQPGALPAGTTVTASQVSDASAVGIALIKALDPAAQRTALGLGSAATQPSTAFATSAQGALAATALQPGALPAGTTVTDAQISNASTIGRNILKAATPALAQSAMSLGSAATKNISDFATAAQGVLAASALQPSAIGTTVAGLTAGKLATSVLPDLAIVQYLGVVGSQTSMLALTGQQGDWCTRSDLGTVWVISGATPSSISNWTQLSYPAASVQSVAGKTGVVSLTSADLSDTGAYGQAFVAFTSAQEARNSIAGVVTSGQFLRGNGTNVVMSAIQAADVPTLNQNTTGSAAKLTTARTISTTGDATGSTTFDGSANASIALTLTDTPVVAGTYNAANVTVDSKGRVINISEGSYAASSALQPGTYLNQAVVTAASAIGVDILKNATATGQSLAKATSPQSARNTIAGTATLSTFLRGDGTNVAMDTIKVSDVPTLNQNTTGSAAKLATARNIAITGAVTGSTTFDGSVNVTIDTTLTGAYATSTQGAKADTALQPGSNGQLTQAVVNLTTLAGVDLLKAADAAAQRSKLGLGTAATTAATAYATSTQGTKADSALQPGAHLNQTVVSAAKVVAAQLLSAADTAAMRGVLGLGSAALNESTTFSTTGHTHISLEISNSSVVGRQLLEATDAPTARGYLNMTSSDITVYRGTWASVPLPTTLAVNNKLMITDLGQKFKKGSGVTTLYVTQDANTSQNIYTLDGGVAVLHDYIFPTTEPTTTAYNATNTRIATSVECAVPATFIAAARLKLELILRQTGVDVQNRSIIYVRFGSTKTASDRIVYTIPADILASDFAITVNIAVSGLTGWIWGNTAVSGTSPAPVTFTAGQYSTTAGTSNYFTFWVVGGAAGETSVVQYQRLEVSF